MHVSAAEKNLKKTRTNSANIKSKILQQPITITRFILFSACITWPEHSLITCHQSPTELKCYLLTTVIFFVHCRFLVRSYCELPIAVTVPQKTGNSFQKRVGPVSDFLCRGFRLVSSICYFILKTIRSIVDVFTVCRLYQYCTKACCDCTSIFDNHCILPSVTVTF